MQRGETIVLRLQTLSPVFCCRDQVLRRRWPRPLLGWSRRGVDNIAGRRGLHCALTHSRLPISLVWQRSLKWEGRLVHLLLGLLNGRRDFAFHNWMWCDHSVSLFNHCVCVVCNVVLLRLILTRFCWYWSSLEQLLAESGFAFVDCDLQDWVFNWLEHFYVLDCLAQVTFWLERHFLVEILEIGLYLLLQLRLHKSLGMELTKRHFGWVAIDWLSVSLLFEIGSIQSLQQLLLFKHYTF